MCVRGEEGIERGMCERETYCPFCSYVSRLVESMDPLKLDVHSAVLGKWLSETSPDVTMKLSSYCCDYLFGAFVRKAQWSHVVELFNSCSRYVHELGARVCNPLSTALQQLGPVVKLISVAEILMEDQIARMSTEVYQLNYKIEQFIATLFDLSNC